MSGHPWFASLARLPDRSTPCRPASAEASNRAVGPASNPFRHRYGEATIQQARDRAEVLWGATRPEWVTSASSLELLLTGARNGLAKCLLKVMSADRPRDRTDVHVVMDRAQATWPRMAPGSMSGSDQTATSPKTESRPTMNELLSGRSTGHRAPIASSPIAL
jgi:hypothetical protein